MAASGATYRGDVFTVSIPVIETATPTEITGYYIITYLPAQWGAGPGVVPPPTLPVVVKVAVNRDSGLLVTTTPESSATATEAGQRVDFSVPVSLSSGDEVNLQADVVAAPVVSGGNTFIPDPDFLFGETPNFFIA